MRKVTENRNCPYCLSLIDTDEERIRCPKCGVIHHTDCWKANGSCSVYGCDGWAVWDSQITDRLAPEDAANYDLTKTDSSASGNTEIVCCIECGKEVKRGQVTCFSCKRKNVGNYYFDNCAGPSVLFLCGVIGIITLIARALS